MADYSRQEAAERTGITADGLDRLIELEVIVPSARDRFTEGGIRKIGLVLSLQSSGIPDETLAAEIKSRRLSFDFFDNPGFDHFSALSPVTFDELSAQRDIPVELLLVIREAIGSALAKPTDRVRDIELAIVPLIEAELACGYPRDAVERLLRTMGDSLRRFVLAEADAFARYVIGPVGHLSGDEIGAAAATTVARMAGHPDAATLAVYHAQQAHAWTTNMIEGFEEQLAAAGLYGQVERPPAMCFLDITGYTRLTAERGDKAAADLADTLGRLVQRTSMEHGGRPVKWLGDGVMFYFRDPGPGVLAAVEMAEGVANAGLPPAHVGLHAGPVVFQNGDYYGQTVNVASRIAEYARPGEVLVSQAVVDAALGSAVTFAEIGPVDLKGVASPVVLHAARRG